MNMKQERLKKMIEYVKEKEMCKLDTLCSVFNISKVTVRRDVEELCKLGVIDKIHGGVKIVNKGILPTIPYKQRDIRNVSEKEYIGKLASDIINDGDTIFIDSGTTTLRLIKYITGKKINLITNNLNVLHECLEYSNINIIVSGGEFSRITKSFVGDYATNLMSIYNITKAFIAATGASTTCGFTNSAPAETIIKKGAISKSQEKYVMMDHEKWNVISLTTFAALTDVTGVITNKQPPVEFMDIFSQNNIKVLY